MRNRDKDIDITTQVDEEPVVKKETITVRPKKYIITVTNLAIRANPNGEKIGIAEAGQTLITEVKDGFGRLADGSGWISMQYTRKVD